MRVLLFMAVCIGSFRLQAQYTVIHCIGKIQDVSSGEYLRPGMKLGESAQLKFETAGAKAAALSPSRGRCVIQMQSTTGASNELLYVLSSVLSPAQGRLSTRAGAINNRLDFQKKFGEGAVAWLSETYKVAVSPTAYPMSNTQFFYASYEYQGERINKKLGFEQDTLIFEKTSFFSIDDRLIDAEKAANIELYYYDERNEESERLTTIDFNLVSDDDLRGLLESLAGIEKSERAEVTLDFVNTLYGKCTPGEMDRALKSL